MDATRRVFMGMAAGSAAFAAGANDRIGIGLIGAGGRGTFHLGDLEKIRSENIAVTAICDVHRPTLEKAITRAERAFGVKPRATTDYRELLTWREVDAVILAAPDFTHSEMTERAVEAGKDVYCEKPMGTRFDEARRAYLAVKRSDRVVQIGTQRRSDPGLAGAAKLMRDGVLGRVTRVDMEVNFQEPRWRRDFEHIQEKDIDWPRFLMGRSDRPFDARRFREWQLFRDYTNGLPGLWMSHFIDLVPWFLEDPYPRSVVASGGVYLWKDGRETEDVIRVLLDYPKGFLVSWAMSLTNAAGARNLWFGTRGTLDADALKITGEGSKQPDRIMAESKVRPIEMDTHMQNFLRCVRSRKAPRADVQAGFSHAVAGCMAAEALRTGRRVTFDREQLEMV